MRSGFFGVVMALSALVLLLSAVPSGAADEVAFPRGSAWIGALPAIDPALLPEE